MVLPLIPLVLIAAGSASGLGGIALGGKGAQNFKRAQDGMRGDEKRHRRSYQLTEDEVAKTNRRLAEYGHLQEAALRDVVLRMGEFLRRNERKVRESERILVEGIDVEFGSVRSKPTLDADTVAWMRGALGSALTGTGVSATVTGAVGTYGVASTGAAISGLSGAAAESATLAALGGGSLASGGGGMALGATALNFAAIGPAILVSGFVIHGQGEKALTKAREYHARVEIALAELADTRSRLEAIRARVDELGELLSRLVGRSKEALDELESEEFDPELHADRFRQAMNLVMAVRDVASTGVIDGEGDLNDKTSSFQVKYRDMTQE